MNTYTHSSKLKPSSVLSLQTFKFFVIYSIKIKNIEK